MENMDWAKGAFYVIFTMSHAETQMWRYLERATNIN
jgi:hypothetical protein